MAQYSIWDDFLEEVYRMKFEIEYKDPLPVAQAVVKNGSIEHNSSRLPLPLHCSEDESNVCDLIRLLPSLNDLLYVIGAELTEVAPGRIAIHGHIVISLEYCWRRGLFLLEAVMFLFCIVAKHHCVDTFELRLQPQSPGDISPLMVKVLNKTSALRCFCLEDSQLTDEATSAAFDATTRLLRSPLAELSLCSIRLLGHSENAHASLNGFMLALSETRELKRLKIVNMVVLSKVPGSTYDFHKNVLKALTSNTSVCHLTLDISFAGRSESFKQMLSSPGSLSTLTILSLESPHHSNGNFVFQALETNNTITKELVELPQGT